MKTIKGASKSHLPKTFSFKTIIFFFVGLAALTWFLVRVIPKPSRAAYPCQQAAFPVASAFVIWLSGILSSSFIFVKAKIRWRRSSYVIAAALFLVAMSIFMITSTSLKYTPAVANLYVYANGLLGNPLPVKCDHAEGKGTVVEPVAYVSIVKSSQQYAKDIEFDEIVQMVQLAVEDAGGLEDIIQNGDTVIIKPNLVVSYDGTSAGLLLDPEVNGITTDYRVVQAVVDMVNEINPNGTIFIVEGSADGSTANNMVLLNYTQITGVDSLICLEDACGEWDDTTSVYLQGVSLPPGKALYQGANNRYWLYKLYYQADVVISMPVLKNHEYAGITCSIKNVGIGATPPTIYAYYPNILRWKIDHENPPRTNLHYWIHDFFMCRPVDFVIMDGLQSVQNGPIGLSSHDSIAQDQMNMRMILAGKDPVATDAIAGLLMGHDPDLVPHLVTLHNDSLGCCDSRLIRVNGAKVGDEKKDFDIYDTGTLSKYTDFDPPNFSIEDCYVNGSQLHFSLQVGFDVTKVEVKIDSVYLNQIVIAGFDDFFVELDTIEITGESNIIVFAYDKYLNYSSQQVSPVTTVPEDKKSGDNLDFISIYPIPFSDNVTIKFSLEYFAEIDIIFLDSRGERIEEFKLQGSRGTHQFQWHPSDLPGGIYYCCLCDRNKSFIKKIIKVK